MCSSDVRPTAGRGHARAQQAGSSLLLGSSSRLWAPAACPAPVDGSVPSTKPGRRFFLCCSAAAEAQGTELGAGDVSDDCSGKTPLHEEQTRLWMLCGPSDLMTHSLCLDSRAQSACSPHSSRSLSERSSRHHQGAKSRNSILPFGEFSVALAAISQGPWRPRPL